jgi:hypothetical protein
MVTMVCMGPAVMLDGQAQRDLLEELDKQALLD